MTSGRGGSSLSLASKEPAVPSLSSAGGVGGGCSSVLEGERSWGGRGGCGPSGLDTGTGASSTSGGASTPGGGGGLIGGGTRSKSLGGAGTFGAFF